MFCIPKQVAEKMKEALKSGKWTPEKFKHLNTAQARKQLAKIVGSEQEAKNINLLFEKKLLLKNQELAMYNFVQDVTGLNKEQKEEMSAKIKKVWADKKRMVENPTENERHLEEIITDVYNRKYNLDIDDKTAGEILELSKEFKTAENKWQEALDEDGNYKNPKDEFTVGLDYGVKREVFERYIETQKMEAQAKDYEAISKDKTVTDNAKAMAKNIKEFGFSGLFSFVADNSRALKASFDLSFKLRQARKAMRWGTRKEFWKMFIGNYKYIWKALTVDFTDGNWKKLKTKQGLKNFFFNKNVIAKLNAITSAEKAAIYARPNFAKGRYDSKGGTLDIGVREEETPTSLPSRIPLIGRFFAVSEFDYGMSAMRLRVDIADNFYQLAETKQTMLSKTFEHSPYLKKKFEREVVDMSDPFEVGSINKVINDMTGRGAISHRIIGEEGQKALNTAVFSVKFAQSQVNTLLSWAYFPTSKFAGRSKFARRQSAMNLLWLLSTSYIIQGMFSMIDGDDDDTTEYDLTSADSGKIRFKNTRFDITGGLGSYMTLLSRIIARILGKGIKSSVTGIKDEAGGYKTTTALDIMWNFIENKTSPIASVLKNILKDKKTFEGEKMTPKNTLVDMTIPIVFETGYDAYKTDGVVLMIVSLILDGLGVSANTYAYSGRWKDKTSIWAEKFRKEKGQKKLERAGERYDRLVNKKILELGKDKEYLKLNNDEQMKELEKEKTKIKKETFILYGFEE